MCAAPLRLGRASIKKLDSLNPFSRQKQFLLWYYFYGSPDYKNTNLHYRKMLLTKRIIQGMNIFYILSEKKSFFFSRRGSTGNPPPPDIGQVGFFYTLTHTQIRANSPRGGGGYSPRIRITYRITHG